MLQQMAKTLAAHRSGLLAYYDGMITSGPMEGTNNKIKTMKRQAYGFRDRRIFNLSFSSKLTLDRKLFQQTNDYIELAGHIAELIEKLDSLDAMHKQDPQLKDVLHLANDIIKNNRGYKCLTGHKEIDYFTLIPFTAASANAADFSKATIEARIKAGSQEAERQGIAEPKRVP